VALKEADRHPTGKEFVDKFEQLLDSEVNGITMEAYEFNTWSDSEFKQKGTQKREQKWRERRRQQQRRKEEAAAKEEEKKKKKKEQAKKGNFETVSQHSEPEDADDHQGDSRGSGRKLRRMITGRVVGIDFPQNIEHRILESVDGDSKKWTDMKKKMAQSPNRFF
jgi:hypothetical protein